MSLATCISHCRLFPPPVNFPSVSASAAPRVGASLCLDVSRALSEALTQTLSLSGSQPSYPGPHSPVFVYA